MRKPIHFHHFPQIKKEDFFERLKKISEPIAVVSKVGLFIGLILLLFYFAQNSFIPVVSFQDTFLLVFVVLGFGFVATVGLLYSAFALLWLFWLILKGAKFFKRDWGSLHKYIDGWRLTIPSFLVFIVFGSLIFAMDGAHWLKFKHDELDTFLMGILAAGFIIMLFYGYNPPTKIVGSVLKDKKTKLLATAWAITLLLFLLGSPRALLNFTMLLTSIRQQNVAVELNEKDYQDLAAKAELYGFKPKVCQLPDGYLVSDVDLIWHGVGSKTRLVIYQKNPEKNVKDQLMELPFTFNSDNLSVMNAKNKIDDAVCIKP